MTNTAEFDLRDFTPYLLAMATESASLGFQQLYASRYGMLRTEWRVLFHVGRAGALTAREICDRARLHKTKVSRAVAALEEKRFLVRQRRDDDRRQEDLRLTRAGSAAFRDLTREAQRYDATLMADLSEEERRVLRRCLRRIAGL